MHRWFIPILAFEYWSVKGGTFGTNTLIKKYSSEAFSPLELLNLLKIMMLFPETVLPITVVIWCWSQVVNQRLQRMALIPWRFRFAFHSR